MLWRISNSTYSHVPSHAYSITGFLELTQVDGKMVNLVRLRNPWGNQKEWEGAWGDKDQDNWKLISEEDKKKFKIVKSGDGEFYMAFDDFLTFFKEVNIVHIQPDSMLKNWGGGKTDVFHFNGKWEGETAGGCINDRGESHSKQVCFHVHTFMITLSRSHFHFHTFAKTLSLSHG